MERVLATTAVVLFIILLYGLVYLWEQQATIRRLRAREEAIAKKAEQRAESTIALLTKVQVYLESNQRQGPAGSEFRTEAIGILRDLKKLQTDVAQDVAILVRRG